jgi:hypothetical protein
MAQMNGSKAVAKAVAVHPTLSAFPAPTLPKT